MIRRVGRGGGGSRGIRGRFGREEGGSGGIRKRVVKEKMKVVITTYL